MLIAPCTSWETDGCCTYPDGASEALIEAQELVATELLWQGSGRLYGPCPVTVRVCMDPCDSGGPTGPWRDADGWHNRSCGCAGSCVCGSPCRVYLPGPVTSIEEVTIGADILDPLAYRLVRQLPGTFWLVRADGGCWPSCQDQTVECGEAGAFCVTYLYGLELPQIAIEAVSELACELVKACVPGCDCRLPRNMVSKVRNGVTVTFDTARTWIRTLPSVAAFLDMVNPQGLTMSPSIWTPDLPPIIVEPAASS